MYVPDFTENFSLLQLVRKITKAHLHLWRPCHATRGVMNIINGLNSRGHPCTHPVIQPLRLKDVSTVSQLNEAAIAIFKKNVRYLFPRSLSSSPDLPGFT